MSEATVSPIDDSIFDPEDHLPKRNFVRRCCSLTVDGAHCRASAIRGQIYCIQHLDRNPRAFEEPGYVAIPLLEDHASIRLVCTKTVHALANQRMTSDRANAIVRACNAAARTLPRPAPLKASDAPAQKPGVYVVDENCNWIALPEPVLDAHGNMLKYDQLEPRWTPPAPPPGPDPDRILADSYLHVIADWLGRKAAREAEETALALAAGQPDPYAGVTPYLPGKCPYRTALCPGPSWGIPCPYCQGVRKMLRDDPRFPGDPVVAMTDACRSFFKKLEAKKLEIDQQSRPGDLSEISAVADNSSAPPTCRSSQKKNPRATRVRSVAETACRRQPAASSSVVNSDNTANGINILGAPRGSGRQKARRNLPRLAGGPHVQQHI